MVASFCSSSSFSFFSCISVSVRRFLAVCKELACCLVWRYFLCVCTHVFCHWDIGISPYLIFSSSSLIELGETMFFAHTDIISAEHIDSVSKFLFSSSSLNLISSSDAFSIISGKISCYFFGPVTFHFLTVKKKGENRNRNINSWE